MAYPTIWTDVGLAKLASASPEHQLKVTHIAVGDGGGSYSPLDPTMTALVNEVWRDSSSVPIRDRDDDTILIFEGAIPSGVGGFYIREVGIFDDEGDLIAIGQTAETEKPDPSSGTSLTLTVRFRTKLSNSEETELIYNDAPAIDHQGLGNRDALDAHPMASITGLPGALGNKVDKSTFVYSGAGLSGGGNLSQSRTLSVDFGTGESQVPRGNDSRFSNAREWTADTVPQAEAEDGTAETRRAWSALRVRQAIVAWFQTVTTSFTRTLLGRSSAAQVRNDLGLGTAALRNVVGSAGNVMAEGAYGLGRDWDADTFGYSAVNLPVQIGGYSAGDLPDFAPESDDWNVIHMRRFSQGGESQIAVGNAGQHLLVRFRPRGQTSWTTREVQFAGAEAGVPTSRKINTGDGLTGGGDLSADRTLTVDSTVARYGTSGGNVRTNTQNDARFALASRTISAGDGLTGGGNLSANRTLAVDGTVARYGTGGGNVRTNSQNDARFTRTPYTGSLTDETSFPIGHTLLASRDGNNDLPTRNDGRPVYVHYSDSLYYTIDGTGTTLQLAGLWRFRGMTADSTTERRQTLLFQRVS